MHSDRSLSESEQAWLDELFEQVVARLEDGLPADVATLLAGHAHLRTEVESLVRLAEQITATGPRHFPTVDGYQLLREIGRGGMGAVYLARQQRVGGRLVALKLLPSSLVMSPQSRERLELEAHTIARLAHPNVVVVHDVIVSDEVCAYAMEWVDGCTLADVLAQLGSRESSEDRSASRDRGLGALADLLGQLALPAGQRSYVTYICRVGVAIARALAAVHGAGLVHRDVKPSNILLRRDGTPLLSDFGLVRDADATLTQPGHFVGTLAYAPPEQLRGDSAAIDTRSDVYALGATLYHALALRVPFAGSNPHELASQIERGLARPLRKVNPRIPFDLQTIVAKAMDADPRRRYQSADEMADDLERLLNLQPIRARPAGLVTRTLKLARRNRGTLAGTLLGSALTLGLAIAAVVYLFLAPRWAAAEARAARLALLAPGMADALFNLEIWGFAPSAEPYGPQRAQLAEALACYDRALRWAPFDRVLRAERDEVRRRQTSRPLDRADKAAASHPASAGAAAPPALPSLELRELGLRSYLAGDIGAALDAWRAYEIGRGPIAPSDPLVDAALGLLYLIRDEPARAYPRLSAALREFPEAGFLALYTADAAIKCGDVDRAAECLRLADARSVGDALGGRQRIEAALLAARGRDADAEALFRKLFANPAAELEYAEFLSRGGHDDEALMLLVRLAERFRGSRPHAAFVRAFEHWWAGRRPAERLACIRAALDLPPGDPRSLATRLREYVEGTEAHRHEGTKSGGTEAHRHATATTWTPSCLRACVPPCLLRISAALYDALSSPSLQSLSLSELASRMEVNDMSLWNHTASQPDFVKNLQFLSWRYPLLKRAAKLLPGVPRTGASTAPGASPRRLARAVPLVLLCAQAALAQAWTTYDASLGTLPTSQGWAITDTGGNPSPSVTGGMLSLGPTISSCSSGYQYWDRNDVANDSTTGFALETRLKVISSNWFRRDVCPGNPPDYAPGYYVIIADALGRSAAAGITQSGVRLLTGIPDDNWLVPVVTTDDFHTYRIEVLGNVATLKVDGVTVDSAALSQPGNYPANYVLFGDGAGYGTSQTQLQYVAYGPLPSFTTYDASLGTLPEAQCWTHAGVPMLLEGGRLHIQTGPGDDGSYATRNDIVFDHAQGCEIECVVEVLDAGCDQQAGSNAPRFGFGFSAADASGYAVYVWFCNGTTALANTPYAAIDGVNVKATAYDIRGGTRTVRLESGPSGYSLFVDNSPVLNVPLGTPIGSPDGTDVWFGDGTGAPNATVDAHVTSFRIAGTSPPCCASPPCFQGLGDLPGGSYSSSASAVSSDGTTVVGQSTSANGMEAIRWTTTGGLVSLGDLPGGDYSGAACGVSGDGSYVTGTSSSSNGQRDAFRWSLAGGMASIGDLPGGGYSSEGAAISDDGAIIVGNGHAAGASRVATRWSESSGVMSSLGVLPGGVEFSEARGITRDGTVVVGHSCSANAPSWPPSLEAFRWTQAGGMTGLGDLPGGIFCSGAKDVSDDGSIIVGIGNSALGQEAMRWTQSDGMQGLGDFPDGAFGSLAAAISGDGALVVGYGTTAVGLEAAVWNGPSAIQRVADVLAANGVGVPAGWELTTAWDVAINGNVVTLCGDGINPDGHPEAWIARFTLAPTVCRGDADCDGDVDFFDIDPFVAKLGCPGAGAGCGAPCAWQNADVDEDGDVDFFDIDPFVATLGTVCP